MKILSNCIICFLLFFLTQGCIKNNHSPIRKNITGNPGEVLIVFEKDSWNQTIDTLLLDLLQQPQPGLPSNEPIFDIITIPPTAFSSVFKSFRNVILIYKGSEVKKPGVFYSEDKFARSQSIVTISANHSDSIIDLIKTNDKNIVSYFLTSERNRLIKDYSKQINKSIAEKVKKTVGIEIILPTYFTLAKSTTDFLWARYETPETSQGIFIFSTPINNVDPISLDFLTDQRDEVLKKNVPGPTEGSFMITEKKIPIRIEWLNGKDNNRAIIRGLWKVENDFMGGPFVSQSFIDTENKRIITIEGYVYAPTKTKRNLLRQVEAVVYSAHF